MKLADHTENLIAAIECAATEHGRPNSFGFAELHLLYGGPSPMIAGRIAPSLHIEGVTFDGGRAHVQATPSNALAYEPFIRIVSLDVEGARDFTMSFLGVPEDRIIKIEDGGPAGRPERYRAEARTWHVYLTCERDQ